MTLVLLWNSKEDTSKNVSTVFVHTVKVKGSKTTTNWTLLIFSAEAKIKHILFSTKESHPGLGTTQALVIHQKNYNNKFSELTF